MMLFNLNIVRLLNASRQNMTRALRVTMAVVLIIVSIPVQAAFEELGVGARAPGMSNAFTAVADDVTAFYYNPAGLAQLMKSEIAANFNRLSAGANDGSELGSNYIGFARPFNGGKNGTLGLGYNDFKLTGLYSERTLSLGYGWMPEWQPFENHGTLTTGATLKHLHREFSPNQYTENALNDAGYATDNVDPIFAANGYSKDAFALDIGALYRFGVRNRWSMGYSATNINRPDVSLAGDGDTIPFANKFGIGFRPKWGVMTAEIRSVKRLAGKSDSEYAVGAERRFALGEWGALEIRGGYAEGSREYKEANAGFSYLFGKTQIDYSFSIPIGNLTEYSGSHRVGFGYRWGAPDLEIQEGDDDLLRSFRDNSLAGLVISKRAFIDDMLSLPQTHIIYQLMIHMYDPASPGLASVRKELLDPLDQKPAVLKDWVSIKETILSSIKDSDQATMEAALEALVSGANKKAIDSIALASARTRKQKLIQVLKSLALVHLAAEEFRSRNVNQTIENVRQIMDEIPNDRVIIKAYKELLLIRVNDMGPIPSAPTPLIAPTPVVAQDQPVKQMTDLERMAKEYGEDLGAYFGRKESGSGLIERQHILNKMMEKYLNKGLDLSIIENELKNVNAEMAAEKAMELEKLKQAPTPAPKALPPVPPAVVTPVAEEPVEAPAKTIIIPKKKNTSSTSEIDKAFDYYKTAGRRGVTDHERIEILESILLRFGETGADEVNRELQRVRLRVKK